jgi:hypothetical protein
MPARSVQRKRRILLRGWWFRMQTTPDRDGRGLFGSSCVRRCPTLPHPVECSTIGAGGLSFRVRNGTGRFPSAMAAVTLRNSVTSGLSRRTHPPHTVGVSVSFLDLYSVVLLNNYSCVVSDIAQWTRSFFVVSPRPISTSHLHTLLYFQFWPINPVVCRGPYPLEGVRNLILEQASRLDAFSGYPFRT